MNQQPNKPFAEMFQPVPDDKAQGGFIEIGQYDQAAGAYSFEGTVSLIVGPDGRVYALVADSPDELPPMGE